MNAKVLFLTIFLVFVVNILLPSGVLASVVTITPDETPVIFFNVIPLDNITPDVISIDLGEVYVTEAHSEMSGILYNGEIPLGTHAESHFGVYTGIITIFSGINMEIVR